uniref:Receptor activity-modifying protein 1 n=1 Tax=Oncorhynchus tshawytscha TaxID=74940 RepID=A0AAZ3PWU5_ONCTS
MALDCTSLTKLTLVLCVAAACGFPPVSGCSDAYGRAIPPLSSCSDAYGRAISDFCVTKFTLDMKALDQSLWCSWSDTFQPYEELTNCTYSVAHKMHCFWPNQQIDELFIRLHRDYFHDCALTVVILPLDATENIKGRDGSVGFAASLPQIRLQQVCRPASRNTSPPL